MFGFRRFPGVNLAVVFLLLVTRLNFSLIRWFSWRHVSEVVDKRHKRCRHDTLYGQKVGVTLHNYFTSNRCLMLYLVTWQHKKTASYMLAIVNLDLTLYLQNTRGKRIIGPILPIKGDISF